MSEDEGYLLDNAQQAAGHRLGVLARLFDPWTVSRLTALGVGRGWRCWEVGAGGPSVPRWLAERAGPHGHVVATDLDTSWLAVEEDTPYDVLRHDVGAEPAPGDGFDLVHARLVLVHVRERAAALSSMVGALRPGGLLVVEDADPALQPLACPDEHGPAEALANRLRTGYRTLLAGRGADLAYGRTLPRLLREQGLTDVEAEAYFPITSPECAELEAATFAQVREPLVASGLATEAEVEEHLANVAAGRLDLTTAPLVTAWGRRP